MRDPLTEKAAECIGKYHKLAGQKVQVIIQFTCIEKIHILSRSRVKLEVHPPPSEDMFVSTARTHAFRLWLDR